jgi:hypothetical protein
MAVTTQQINLAISNPSHRSIVAAVNAGTASLTDIAASLVSLDLKAALRDVKNAVATRVGINARQLDLPTKALLLAIANV